jgi:hypothetical protein
MPHVANQQQAMPTSLHSSYQDINLYTSRPSSLRSSFQELPNLVVTQAQVHTQPSSLRSSFQELPNLVMNHAQPHTQPSSLRSSFSELPNLVVSHAPTHSQPSSLRASFNDAQPPRIVPQHQPNLRASCNDISRLQHQEQGSVWANTSSSSSSSTSTHNLVHSEAAEYSAQSHASSHQDQGVNGGSSSSGFSRTTNGSGSFWHKGGGVGTGVHMGGGEAGPPRLEGRGKTRGPVGMVLTHSTCQSSEGRQLHVHRSVTTLHDVYVTT